MSETIWMGIVGIIGTLVGSFGGIAFGEWLSKRGKLEFVSAEASQFLDSKTNLEQAGGTPKEFVYKLRYNVSLRFFNDRKIPSSIRVSPNLKLIDDGGVVIRSVSIDRSLVSGNGFALDIEPYMAGDITVPGFETESIELYSKITKDNDPIKLAARVASVELVYTYIKKKVETVRLKIPITQNEIHRHAAKEGGK